MMKEAIDAGRDATQLTKNIVTSLYKVMDSPIHFLIWYNGSVCIYIHIFLVIPVIAEVKIKFPPAVLNKPYIGTCDAAGDPRPIVNASLNTEHCPHSIFITNTTVYTTQAALRIPSVTDECRGAILYCCVCQLETCQVVTMELNVITEGKSTTHCDHHYYSH